MEIRKYYLAYCHLNWFEFEYSFYLTNLSFPSCIYCNKKVYVFHFQFDINLIHKVQSRLSRGTDLQRPVSIFMEVSECQVSVELNITFRLVNVVYVCILSVSWYANLVLVIICNAKGNSHPGCGDTTLFAFLLTCMIICMI